MTNQARISAINLELTRLNNDCGTAAIALNRVRAKLDTLRSAKFQLNTLLDNYSNLTTDYSSLDSSIWDSRFRGSLRRSFQSDLSQIERHLQTLKNNHEDRQNIIANAITSAETEETSLQNQITGFNTRINNLEQERRSLL